MNNGADLLEMTKIAGDLPTDRASLIRWIKKSCQESIAQAEEDQDQVGFVVTPSLFADCLQRHLKLVTALAFVVECCDTDQFQISLLPHNAGVMVNTWPRAPTGWGEFKLPS